MLSQLTPGTLAVPAKQVVRYALVGALANVLAYLIYLLLTWYWPNPKVVVTLLYPIGALVSFFGHMRYSFNYDGKIATSFVRYVIAHLIGYSSNIGLLYWLSDRLGYPHQGVQAVAIIVVAGILFLLSRYYVFRRK